MYKKRGAGLCASTKVRDCQKSVVSELRCRIRGTEGEEGGEREGEGGGEGGRRGVD